MSHPGVTQPVPIGPPDSATDGLLRRIRGEFLEMPGLRLTEVQAARLWAMDLPQCSTMLRVLLETNFLFRTPDGAFMRIEHGSPLKASLPLQRKGITAA